MPARTLRQLAMASLLELGRLSINIAGEQVRWEGQHGAAAGPTSSGCCASWPRTPTACSRASELVAALGKAGNPDYLRTVDVWIKRLRAGLRSAGAGRLLRTVHGKGYVLDNLHDTPGADAPARHAGNSA